MSGSKITSIILIMLVFLSGCGESDKAPALPEHAALSGSVDNGRLLTAELDTDNWLLHGRTYMDQRYSPLSDINEETVGHLGLAWYLDLPRDGGQEATPIVVDGVIYISAAWSIVHALDARSGEILWSFDPKVAREVLVKACCGPVNRGVAYDDGAIFVGTLDGRLIALDAKTGKQRWSTATTNSEQSYTITGAPRVANGKVFIGNGGAEFGVRGYISAYDAKTGEQVWRFYTVPGNPAEPFENDILEMAAKTWHGEWWRFGGGGTVYDAISFDPEFNLLYIGVGNAGPYNPKVRSEGKGDNLFVSSIVAVDADTGKYVWHYQTTPGDAWDYTATQNMILADMEINGQQRKVIMQAPKNGFFYVLDRQTGELLSAEPYETVNWASHVDMETGRPQINKSARYWETGEAATVFPSAIGAHNWQPMAYHPETGLVYIPANHMPATFKGLDDFEMKPLGRNTAMDYSELKIPHDPEQLKEIKSAFTGKLLAWDPLSQQAVWEVPQQKPGNGGVLATGGNLVFQGTSLGRFSAFHAATGKELWHFDAQTSVIAAPVSFRVGGEQYIAVLAGRGGTLARFMGNVADPKVINRSRLLVFSLDGEEILPKPNDPTLTLPDLSGIEIDKSRAREGAKHYIDFCASCHGIGAVGGSVAPDLRYSGFIQNEQAFQTIVLDGILKERGMVGFSPVLAKQQTEDLRLYLIQQNQLSRHYGDVERVGR